MKVYNIVCLVLIFSFGVNAQKRVLKEKEGIQTYLSFDNPLPKDIAISSFVKKCKLEKYNVFETTISNTDKVGNIHTRYQQLFNGVKVEFGTLITHSNSEGVYLINGEVYNASNLNLIPTLTKEQGLQVILTKKAGATYLWENSSQAKLMKYSKPEGELVILPNVRSGEINLAYKYDVYTTEPLGRDNIYIDAHTGAILLTDAIIKHANGYDHKTTATENIDKTQLVQAKSSLVAGNADTRYSGTRVIETTFDAPQAGFKLHDYSRGDGVITYNNEQQVNYQQVDFLDNDNNWTTNEHNNVNKDDGALDAHWGAIKTYDFWQNIFGRNSYDDQGATLISYVHYRRNANTSLANAFWNGSVMSYGDGNSFIDILTSIDVCGHEIGHAVCSSTANLVYQNQSGAINEGFSDIWGACIEHYGRTGSLTGTQASGVWLIGEDLSTNPLRSMIAPIQRGDPDTYLGTNWVETGDEGSCTPSSSNDQCGVHTNSGVLNHWFYILTNGKSGTNNAPSPDTYNVTGIGMIKSSEIAYLAERDYLTPNATYYDVREATISVASTLYCGTSPEYIAVTNAWFAVNVGEQFQSYAKDIVLKKVNYTPSISCGSNSNPVVVLENGGTNILSSATITYSIDNGTPVVGNWNGTLGNCQTVNYPLSLGTLSRGTHSVQISVSMVNDENVTNNTKTIIITTNNTGLVNQINTFEATSDSLVSYDEGGTNDLWQRGTASGSVLTNTVAQNSKVYGTNLSGQYPNGMTSYLVSQCYDLTNKQNPVLKFDMAFDIENNWDLLYMQYSINGGTNWSLLGSASDADWYNSSRLPNGSDCYDCVGGQWTGEASLSNPAGGTNGTMRQYQQSLTDFGYGGTTPQSNIVFRFVFHSDDYLQKEGVIIDNFVVTGTDALSNQDFIFDEFSVIPNPSNGMVSVKLTTANNVTLSLFDVRGREVYNQKFQNYSTIFDQEINFGTLEKGVYLLNVQTEGKTATKKIIIK